MKLIKEIILFICIRVNYDDVNRKEISMAKVEAIGAEKAKGPADWSDYYAQSHNNKRANENIPCIWTYNATTATQT